METKEYEDILPSHFRKLSHYDVAREKALKAINEKKVKIRIDILIKHFVRDSIMTTAINDWSIKHVD